MYSVVMMIALSGGAQTPDWGWGCCGGCGGWNYCGWRCCAWRCGCCGWRPFLFHRWGCCGGCGGCGGCVGCVGCVGCAGDGVPVMPGTAPAPGKTFFPSEVSQKSETPNVFVNYSPAQPKETSRPATVLVNLPADARLTFNGWTSTNKSTTRRFRTPALEPGQEYAYTLRAEIVRDGQTIVQNHEVVVRSGQQTRVDVTFPTVVLTQAQQ
jgi:uncharacterized protein (TIGR03000 family)